jgi:hypothetical protein
VLSAWPDKDEIHVRLGGSRGDIDRHMARRFVDDNRHLGPAGLMRELTDPRRRVNKQLSGHPPLLGVRDPVGANLTENMVASGSLTLRGKAEREERSIGRATGQHCEAVLRAPSAADPQAIGTYLGHCHVVFLRRRCRRWAHSD